MTCVLVLPSIFLEIILFKTWSNIKYNYNF